MNHYSKKYYIIFGAGLVVILLLTLPYLSYIVERIFFADNISALEQLTMYQWTSVGVVLYLLLYRLVKHNILWFETFSHEMTHIFFTVILQGRIHSINVGEGAGMMEHSGVKRWALVPVSLAPYCFPMFTYFLLSIRHLMDFHGRWIFDVIIGATIAFHIICFIKQTNRCQTDINQYPLWFSYLYIFTAWIVNICIVAVSFFPNLYKTDTGIWFFGYGMWSSLLRWPYEMYDTLMSLF